MSGTKDIIVKVKQYAIIYGDNTPGPQMFKLNQARNWLDDEIEHCKRMIKIYQKATIEEKIITMRRREAVREHAEIIKQDKEL